MMVGSPLVYQPTLKKRLIRGTTRARYMLHAKPYTKTRRVKSQKQTQNYGSLGRPPKFQSLFWDLDIESSKLSPQPLLLGRWRRLLCIYPKQSTSLPKRRVIAEIPKTKVEIEVAILGFHTEQNYGRQRHLERNGNKNQRNHETSHR